jgi:uncharacterized protein YuzE
VSADNSYPVWKWDAEVNMGYLDIAFGIPDRTVTFSGGGSDRINVDYDEDGNIVGVEVFG